MKPFGTPHTDTAIRVLLLGSGELGKEVAIELQRFAVEVIAVDRYANAPAMQVAHRSHVINMLDGDALRRLGGMPLFPRWDALELRAQELMEQFDVRPRESRLASGRLSGGNLQKLVIARELSEPRRFVVACYPTMGLDLQATQAVYDAMFRQAAGGAAVLWISEDLDDGLLERSVRRSLVSGGGRLPLVRRRQCGAVHLTVRGQR